MRRWVLYAFHILIARPILLGVVGVRYRRRHVVPEGACLVVSNHNSHLDAAVLMTMFPLRRLPCVHPVAAADYFSSWFMRMWAMVFLNSIPIERRPTRGQDPLEPAIRRLQAGESLIFFPEGSRGEAGVVARFRPGVGLLVRAVPGLLVVPVYLSGPERIWPRGRLVPVPMNIDANIGKPRTYPADQDPREIADQVRSDVLALAPPPPPLPGARPQQPLRVAICSVDDARRRELYRRVTERLGTSGKTVGISWPPLEADAEGVRESARSIGRGRRMGLRLLRGAFRSGGRFKGEHFVEMLERARIHEALDHSRDTRFVVADGSVLVDLMALAPTDGGDGASDERGLNRLLRYVTGETSIPLSAWWWFVRHAPEIWLINVLRLARPPIPDILVHLHPSGLDGEPLERGYRRVGSVLRKRRRVEVFELDSCSLETATERVAAACLELVSVRGSVS